MNGNTAGPWTIEQDKRGVARYWLRGGGLYLGSIGSGSDGEEAHARALANATLIAAAPDILVALKDILESKHPDVKLHPDHIFAAKVAIARAEGQS